MAVDKLDSLIASWLAEDSLNSGEGQNLATETKLAFISLSAKRVLGKFTSLLLNLLPL